MIGVASTAVVTCPPWCTTAHLAESPVLEHAGAPQVVAEFFGQPSLSVAPVQVTYLLDSPVETPTVVRVGRDDITPRMARVMAAALLAAADVADGVR